MYLFSSCGRVTNVTLYLTQKLMTGILLLDYYLETSIDILMLFL